MGSEPSKEENKTVDASGVINNTFVTNDKIQIHNQEIVLLLAIIATVQLIQLGIYCYTQHVKKIKKNVKRNDSIV